MIRRSAESDKAITKLIRVSKTEMRDMRTLERIFPASKLTP